MAWQPQEEPLRQLAHYLKDSLTSHDQATQKNAELMLEHAKSSPDIDNYLAYLFSTSIMPVVLNMSPESFHSARSAAAIMLKNNIKTSYRTISDSSKSYICSIVLLALQDLNSQIRNYTGIVIAEIVRQVGIMGWPQILSELISLVSNDTGTIALHTQEGAGGALLKICEDNKRSLDKEYQGQKPLNLIFPKLLSFTSSPSDKVRANALASANVFIPEKPQAVIENMQRLLMCLFQLASDPSDEVRKHVCRSFVYIADICPEHIMPHMEGLVDYMVSQQRIVNQPELALDAAEFWLSIAEDVKIRDCLGPFLPKVVPVLLESIVYNEEDILKLGGDSDDAGREDAEQDIRPIFATSKSARLVASTNGERSLLEANESSTHITKTLDIAELSDGELVDDDDDDDDEENEDPEDQWSLRKCSAAALDVLASVFHEPVFEITLPYLKENLVHSDWPYREAAVLALGAIADGCMEFVQPHLPDLTRFLTSLLHDKEPVVRQITCWSLGRYSTWASRLDPLGRQQYFVPMMDGILQCMLDHNKRVQEAAASAFANLEDKANTQLKDYCEVIVRQFVKCFSKYKDRNMFLLYDCVQTLAEHVGPTLSDPKLVKILMPALIQRWNKVSDESREMFPLLECLSYVATALGDSFSPFAGPIFERCINVISRNLQDSWAASSNPILDAPEKDFLVTSLDLLSAIIQALNEEKSMELVTTSHPNLFDLLAYCLKDANNEVRQSAYALLGDCAIYVFPQLQPYLPNILEILIAQLELTEFLEGNEDTSFSVINNACWSVGEIAMRQREGMTLYVDRLLERLATILFNDKVPESLNENAAIALGRLGLDCSQNLAPHLATIGPPFVGSIRNVDWTDEKGHALKGFAKIVLQNPQAMEHCLLDFMAEMASAPGIFLASLKGDGPFEFFQSALFQYKNLIPNFDAFLHRLPQDKEQALRQIYLL